MRDCRWLWMVAAFAAVALAVFGYRWFDYRYSLRGRFDRIAAGMSKAEVLAVMGPPGNRRSKPWPFQVSEYADVWRVQGDGFVRRQYHGLDVHTEVGLAGDHHAVWKADEGVVLIEYDAAGRVCGKIRLTE